jgi:hypothetical protein
VYVRIDGTMYGLPQAGILAQQRLVLHLEAYSYRECTNTPMLFKHDTKSVQFVLVVDDYAVRSSQRAHLTHFYDTLRQLYDFTATVGGDTF